LNCFYMFDWNWGGGCSPLGRGCKNCACKVLSASIGSTPRKA
jgi:hypothetical protein